MNLAEKAMEKDLEESVMTTNFDLNRIESLDNPK